MPPAPHTAIPVDTWAAGTYTGLWNYLDFPAVVLPVDEVRESDLADDVSNAIFGPDDAQLYSQCKKNEASNLPDLARTDNLL